MLGIEFSFSFSLFLWWTGGVWREGERVAFGRGTRKERRRFITMEGGRLVCLFFFVFLPALAYRKERLHGLMVSWFWEECFFF